MYTSNLQIECWHRYVGHRYRHGKAYRIIRNKLCSDVGIRRDDARRVSPHSVLDLVVILPLLDGACSMPSSHQRPHFNHKLHTRNPGRTLERKRWGN